MQRLEHRFTSVEIVEAWSALFRNSVATIPHEMSASSLQSENRSSAVAEMAHVYTAIENPIRDANFVDFYGVMTLWHPTINQKRDIMVQCPK